MTIPEISKKFGLNHEEKKLFYECISNQFSDRYDKSKVDFSFFDRWKMICLEVALCLSGVEKICGGEI